MNSDQGIWRTAGIMIKRYGDRADFEACIRADEFAENGDRASMRGAFRTSTRSIRLQHVQPGEPNN